MKVLSKAGLKNEWLDLTFVNDNYSHLMMQMKLLLVEISSAKRLH